jgi:hypothetical protein
MKHTYQASKQQMDIDLGIVCLEVTHGILKRNLVRKKENRVGYPNEKFSADTDN